MQKNKKIEQTVTRERNRLFNFIRRRVSIDAEAEDILQDVFYQLVIAFETIESLEKVSSWLFQVARNKIIDRKRKMKAENFSSLATNEEGEPLMLADIIPDLQNVPYKQYLRAAIWESLEDALDEMPVEQQQVFVMHEFENKRFSEIANITGVPVNTLLSRKRYAVLYLRKQLEQLYEELLSE